MKDRLHIVHWILNLGLGGDAKNLIALAKEQSKWARVSIITQLEDLGPRAKNLDWTKIQVIPNMEIQGSSSQFSNWINDEKPDVLIFHRNGAPNQDETNVLSVFCRAGIPCFEYNTFAKVDTATDHLWAGYCHLSLASFYQYANRRGLSPLAQSLQNHAAIGYAVEVPSTVTQEEKLSARKNLAIDDGTYVVARLMRPDLRKWDPMPALSLKKLVDGGTNACLVIRSAPIQRNSWVKSLLKDKVRLLEPSVSEADIRVTLAAADCLVNFSAIGETFGLGLAEGMVLGLPCLTNATPKMDNAQIELCKHNKRGLVANSAGALTAALKCLQTDRVQAEKLGELGRQYIIDNFTPPVVEMRLRSFMQRCLHQQGITDKIFPAVQTSSSYEMSQAWLDDYLQSVNDSFEDPDSPIEKIVSALYLEKQRFEDGLLYAQSIGPAGIVEKIQRRLSQGSLLRK